GEQGERTACNEREAVRNHALGRERRGDSRIARTSTTSPSNARDLATDTPWRHGRRSVAESRQGKGMTEGDWLVEAVEQLSNPMNTNEQVHDDEDRSNRDQSGAHRKPDRHRVPCCIAASSVGASERIVAACVRSPGWSAMRNTA